MRKRNDKMESNFEKLLKEADRSKEFTSNESLSLNNIKKLVEVLENNHNLTSLDLSNATLNIESVKYLSKFIQKKQTLKKCSLRENTIDLEGAKYLSMALKENQSLKKLDLKRNNIGNEGAKHLSEALKKNQRLKTLYLHRNNIDSQGIQYLSDILKTNYNLIKLKFERKLKIPPELKSYLTRNRQLARYLYPLQRAMKKNILLQAESINNILIELDKWLTSYSPEEGSYPWEAYRLLSAVRDLNTVRVGSSTKELQLPFLASFRNPVFQHYFDKENIHRRLNDYINRIESYESYTEGFWFFSTSRGLNRKANHLLAKELRYNLAETNNSIESIFDSLGKKREAIIENNGLDKEQGYQKQGINSSELNRIISLINYK